MDVPRGPDLEYVLSRARGRNDFDKKLSAEWLIRNNLKGEFSGNNEWASLVSTAMQGIDEVLKMPDRDSIVRDIYMGIMLAFLMGWRAREFAASPDTERLVQ